MIAADVYAVQPHTGRGGWTWYTGAAGWYYRLIVESLLGLGRQGDKLRIAPCMRDDWEGFALRYRFGETHYHINVLRERSTAGTHGFRVTLDGLDLGDAAIPLVDDHRDHVVEVKVSTAHLRPRGATA